ncbi:MAG: methionine--tRNA ligase [Opitutales bacterium]
MSKAFYITTAIDYANGSPHLGHAYEKVLTDVIARYRRLMGDEVRFVTGLDEHGQKVYKASVARGISPQAICDGFAAEFQGLCRRLEIGYDDYIRTTEERHKTVVRQLLQHLYDKGDIYLGDYEGYYSIKQEQFVTLKEQVDGEWPARYGEVVEISEPNYFFRLQKYQPWLIDHLEANPDFVFPRYRQKQVLEFLKEPINDLCISRPMERLPWGISMPFDEKYVTYVWFDALINYVTAAGYGSDAFDTYWPADYHVIGKDILVPSHSVYWPIMLKACEIPLPGSLLVHGFWMKSGKELSKSAGHIVDPLELVDRFGPDAFRYFVTREMNVGQDSDFSVELFLSRYTNDLGNDLGNLVSRLLNMGGRYCGGTLPAASVDGEPEQQLKAVWEDVRPQILDLYAGFQFHTGLEQTFTFIRAINRYAEQRAPWKLAKSDAAEDKAALETSLATMAEGLRLAATCLIPVMPGVAAKIHQLVDLELPDTWSQDTLAWSNQLDGNLLGEKTILFPRPHLPE